MSKFLDFSSSKRKFLDKNWNNISDLVPDLFVWNSHHNFILTLRYPYHQRFAIET